MIETIDAANIAGMPDMNINVPAPGEVPFGDEVMRPVDEILELGTLACIQNLNSKNDDSGLGSGSNDDWAFTDVELGGDRPGSVISLN